MATVQDEDIISDESDEFADDEELQGFGLTDDEETGGESDKDDVGNTADEE